MTSGVLGLYLSHATMIIMDNFMINFVKSMILYLISPASYFVKKYNIDGENMMLLRMTINICYYTAIISIYFLL